MPFPRSRFQQAGATLAELDVLQTEHEGLPDNMQGWNEQHWAGMDTEGLRAALAVRRSHGIQGVGLPAAESIEELAAGATVTVDGVGIPGTIKTIEDPTASIRAFLAAAEKITPATDDPAESIRRMLAAPLEAKPRRSRAKPKTVKE